MVVTKIDIRKHENKHIIGYASITFNDVMTIPGFVIKTGKYGTFVSVPETLGKDGEYHPTVYIKKELKDEIEKAIKEKLS